MHERASAVLTHALPATMSPGTTVNGLLNCCPGHQYAFPLEQLDVAGLGSVQLSLVAQGQRGVQQCEQTKAGPGRTVVQAVAVYA
jgi:hypothetical protein